MTTRADDSNRGDATTTAALFSNQLTRETRRLCAGERRHQHGREYLARQDAVFVGDACAEDAFRRVTGADLRQNGPSLR